MADGEILQRFTPPAIRVIQYAKEEARRSRWNTVGTEHLLLGLIREREGIAARVLERVGASPGRVQDEVKRQMEQAEKPAHKQPSRTWSAGARRVLERALEEARELNPKLGLPNFVDTGHLLLALLREPEAMGARVLIGLGVDLEQVRRETVQMMGASAESAEVPPEQVRAQAHPADREILQRFTPPAIRVIQYAKEEARRFRGNTVGTEHVLLGLIREQEGLAARVLERLGVSLGRTQNEIRRQMDMEGEERNPPPGSRTWSPGARRTLEFAIEEARTLNPKLGLPNFVDTEHLLLAVTRETDTRAVRVLIKMGVDLDQIRREVVKLLGGAPSAAARPAPPVYVDTPVLDAFGRDLTRLAREDKLDPLIGRAAEMQQVIHLLARRARNRPLLIGERGVGKTAIVEGLAQRIVRKEVPGFLQERRVLALDATRLVIGIRREVVAEIRKAGHQLVLFITRMEALGAAGAEEDVIGLSALLSVIADQHDTYCLGATTPAHYREGMEKNPAVAGYFQPVAVREPSADETIAILKGLRARYEAHHRVQIDDGALAAAVQLSTRHLTDRFLPEKAIDLIDEAASRLRPDLADPPENVLQLRRELDRVQRELLQVVSISPLERNEADYQHGVQLRDERHRLGEELNQAEETWRAGRMAGRTRVMAEDVVHIVSAWTGKPLSEIESGEEGGA